MNCQQPPNAGHTAAQMAEALGRSPRVVRRWLGPIPPDGFRVVRGNRTATWRWESLPVHLQTELETARRKRGFRSVAALLGEPDVWQPEIPWHEVAPEQQAEALQLQRALLPVLARRNEPGLSASGLESFGVAEYARAFGGRAITPKRWRYLFDRTLARDRGAEQFHRPELFLPANPRRAASTSALAGDADFQPLSDCLARFGDPLKPTLEETDALWIAAVDLFRDGAPLPPARFKRRLLDFLWQRAPFLAKSANALRASFDRKLNRAEQAQGETLALLDGRALKRGEPRAPAITPEDVDRLVWHSARNCGGRTTQAIRELGALGERSRLSKATLDLINAPHANKSHVNRRLFSAVHRDVQLIGPYLLGRKAIDDATPSLRRDYSQLRSMDVVTADDFTMPVYFFLPDGRGGWSLTRGQCLLMIDCRSLRIIGWSLQPERNYNSLVIRSLMNRTCREHGLPGVWYFEGGIWKHARVVKGAPREWREGKSWAEYAPGWARLGVRFIHAKRARSKPAELVGGLLQNLMERVRGYCGRDERRDCPEVTRRNKLAVEAGVEPHGLFLSFDGWEGELGTLIATYNATDQQGEILQGLSPDKAFQAHWPHDDPPAVFDASCWHLLAHYVSEREVTTNGITFRIGSELYEYYDEHTSALRGKKVLAWFDPDCPELLGVTDLRGRNPVLVGRADKVDFRASVDPDAQAGREYQEQLAKVEGHNRYPKARFHTIKAKFEPTFRQSFVAPAVEHVAQTFAVGRNRIQEHRRETERRRSGVVERARKLGLPPALVRHADESDVEAVAEGVGMMARAERAMAESETKGPGSSIPGKKIYHLKCSGGSPERDYVEYLIRRLTEFRRAGAGFGQKFNNQVSPASTTRIAASQLGCDLYSPEHFERVCDYLKQKIDATVLGKRNTANGRSNYHDFLEQETV